MQLAVFKNSLKLLSGPARASFRVLNDKILRTIELWNWKTLWRGNLAQYSI